MGLDPSSRNSFSFVGHFPYQPNPTKLAKALARSMGELHVSFRATRVCGILDPGAMSVDTIVAYLHVCVGACLMLGLFTRTASVAGALFMLSVVAAQPPWVAGAQPMYKESVEMLALLALATTGAGRFAGLDYVIGGMLAGCCRGSKQGIQR